MSDTEYLSPISRAGPFIAGPWHRANATYAAGIDKDFLPETIPAVEVEMKYNKFNNYGRCQRSGLDYICSTEDPGQSSPTGDVIELRHVPVCAALTPSPDNINNWRFLMQKLTRETDNCSATTDWWPAFITPECPTPLPVYNLETITSLPFNLQATAGVVNITLLPLGGYSNRYSAYGFCSAVLRFAYQSNRPVLLNLTGTAAAASSYTTGRPAWGGGASASVLVGITYTADNTGTSVASESIDEFVSSDIWVEQSGAASVNEDVDITVTLPARVVPGIVRIYAFISTSAEGVDGYGSTITGGGSATVTTAPTYNLNLNVPPA